MWWLTWDLAGREFDAEEGCFVYIGGVKMTMGASGCLDVGEMESAFDKFHVTFSGFSGFSGRIHYILPSKLVL